MTVFSVGQSVRSSRTRIDDEFALIRRRFERNRKDAISELERLKRYLAAAGEPSKREDWVSIDIRLELARERVQDVLGSMGQRQQ